VGKSYSKTRCHVALTSTVELPERPASSPRLAGAWPLCARGKGRIAYRVCEAPESPEEEGGGRRGKEGEVAFCRAGGGRGSGGSQVEA
jgi:hypothetical protein